MWKGTLYPEGGHSCWRHDGYVCAINIDVERLGDQDVGRDGRVELADFVSSDIESVCTFMAAIQGGNVNVDCTGSQVGYHVEI